MPDDGHNLSFSILEMCFPRDWVARWEPPRWMITLSHGRFSPFPLGPCRLDKVKKKLLAAFRTGVHINPIAGG